MNESSGKSLRVTHLRQLEEEGWLSFLGTDGPGRNSTLAVEVLGGVRVFPDTEMVHWIDGFRAGIASDREAAASSGIRRSPEIGDDERRRRRLAIDSLRTILVNPSPTDQVRLLVRLAMQRKGMGQLDLVGALGTARKTVTDAMKFGPAGPLGIVAVTGHDTQVRMDLAQADPKAPLTPQPVEGWVEPDSIRALRTLCYAHEQGVLTLLDPLEVNRATQTHVTYTVRVGEVEHQVPLSAVYEWVIGVADALAPDVAISLYTGPSR